MFKSVKSNLLKHIGVQTFAIILFSLTAAQAQQAIKVTGIGRLATPAEISAWDIDVRPDFKGIPKGEGTADQGQNVWESKCASCHGTFGESNEVFTPIIGGTTAEDIKTGRVASLTDPKQPQRTTLMKVATLSSLYDYIYRAMPWNAPRSLTPEETYSVMAYMLSMAEIVADDFTLSDQNMSEVQQRMPNRNGMTTEHGMWNANGKPDVSAKACMKDCVTEIKITSELPDYARNAHGNLAEQNRIFGPYRGVNSTMPSLKSMPDPKTLVAADAKDAVHAPVTINALDVFKKNNCNACHAATSKLVGPSIAEISAKYKDQPDILSKLVMKVQKGGSGAWGSIPMPPHPQIPESDIRIIVQWMLKGS